MPTPEEAAIRKLEAELHKLRSELNETRHNLHERISKLQNDNFKLFTVILFFAHTALLVAILK